VARGFIGLGANLGDPAAQLRAALAAIASTPGLRLVAQSRLYRSAPLGPADQPDYCNAVCAVETALEPAQLMAALLAIERAAGRVRDGSRWGPRRLDLDLLHVEGVRCIGPELELPHPEIARRNFVLVPWAEIAPTLVLEGAGTVGALAQALGNAGLRLWE
jgi:2-amino-4-hydroxy-6-hydroxymethyldihydropteridine diphosphokinase